MDRTIKLRRPVPNLKLEKHTRLFRQNPLDCRCEERLTVGCSVMPVQGRTECPRKMLIRSHNHHVRPVARLSIETRVASLACVRRMWVCPYLCRYVYMRACVRACAFACGWACKGAACGWGATQRKPQAPGLYTCTRSLHAPRISDSTSVPSHRVAPTVPSDHANASGVSRRERPIATILTDT